MEGIRFFSRKILTNINQSLIQYDLSVSVRINADKGNSICSIILQPKQSYCFILSGKLKSGKPVKLSDIVYHGQLILAKNSESIIIGISRSLACKMFCELPHVLLQKLRQVQYYNVKVCPSMLKTARAVLKESKSFDKT